MTLPGAIQGCQFERPVIKRIGFDGTAGHGLRCFHIMSCHVIPCQVIPRQLKRAGILSLTSALGSRLSPRTLLAVFGWAPETPLGLIGFRPLTQGDHQASLANSAFATHG